MITADTIIPALPLLPDLTLYNDLKSEIQEVFTAGDCENTGLIADAIACGVAVARVL